LKAESFLLLGLGILFFIYLVECHSVIDVLDAEIYKCCYQHFSYVYKMPYNRFSPLKTFPFSHLQ